MDGGRIEVQREGSDALGVRMAGSWKLARELPGAEAVLGPAAGVQRIRIDASGVSDWDSGLVAFLVQVVAGARARGIEVRADGLPDGARRLLELASAVPEQRDGRERAGKPALLARIGASAIEAGRGTRAALTFVGEAALSLGRLVTGRARWRRSDFFVAVQECGVEALGIVSLISFLIGSILAFMGAVQLELFGAEIYVADLVAIGMAREMGAMMTGVIMAGRTGAAYAAQLGTMTVNEEIDALETLGIRPMDFLVLPRMLALAAMMPLLTLYADLLGIAGGMAVGIGMLGIAPAQYWNETVVAVTLTDFGVGLIKAAVLGVLVALAGCMRGMQCGRSAAAVGLATTSAVVTAIVWIVVSEAVFAVVFSVLGI
jgi:phospholipid/cholesterol/gamma-HCH transport system permease protein